MTIADKSLAEKRRRLERVEGWLYGPADSFGECDQCHDDVVALWDDVDTEGCGDFQYCRRCWDARVAMLKATIKRLKGWQAEAVPTRQRVLLTGLDCLPGQQDLFEENGR